MNTLARPSFMSRTLSGLALLALPLAGLTVEARAQEVPSPTEFFGQRIGADYFLANYTQLTAYWKRLEEVSDNIVLEEIGTTSYGQPMIMAIISSAENLDRREEFRRISERMARARDLTSEQAHSLAEQGRSVVWIDGGLHATESVAGQNIIELPYRMLSQTDKETRNILENTILLAVPVNPDGLEMVANAYMATRSMSLPVLYQRYVGHDNNRDFYMANQKEAEAINRIHYRQWYPQIIYNHHQTGPSGTVLFVPPFRDPFNYNIDPMVIRGIEIVGAHMNHRFSAELKPGAINRSGASYSTWWNGGLRTAPYWHNMIGILTEARGNPTPEPISVGPNRRVPYSDYPDPLPDQELWHAWQTIEYLQTSDFAILDYAARYKDEMLYNIYTMGRKSIDRGNRDYWTPTPKLMEIAREREQSNVVEASLSRQGGRIPLASKEAVDAVFSDPALRDPRGYIIPANQPDKGSVVRFVNVLIKGGVEVHRATASFNVNGVSYPAGSFVVKSAQAFRPQVLDMFEPQWHPDDIAATGEPIRPYDSAGWTVAMQMDVKFDRILEGFDGPFEPLADKASPAAGTVSQGSAGYLVDHRNSNSFIVTNRLLKGGHQVYWLPAGMSTQGRAGVAGDIFIPSGGAVDGLVRTMAAELGVSFHGVGNAPTTTMTRINPVRIGLFDTFGGNMPTGWTQWVLEQFEFPVEQVFGQRIAAGNLGEDYDVLLFHTGLPNPQSQAGGRGGRRGNRGGRGRRGGRGGRGGGQDLDTLRNALPPFEDWSNLEARRVRLTVENSIQNLKDFMEGGGTVIALGSEAGKMIGHLELPVRVGAFTADGQRVGNAEFYIPGSLVAIDVDASSTLGYGVSPALTTMWRGSQAFDVQDGAAGVSVVATYDDGDPLVSGWAIGQEIIAGKPAILSAKVGAGHLHLFGPDVLYRAQPHGSFKLVFNGIQASASR